MDDPGAGKAGAICEVGGVYCCSKPLLSMLVQATELTKQALSPASPQVSKAWRDVAAVQQAASSLCACFVQDMVVNVNVLESYMWSQGLGGKSECVHVCANSNT